MGDTSSTPSQMYNLTENLHVGLPTLEETIFCSKAKKVLSQCAFTASSPSDGWCAQMRIEILSSNMSMGMS